MIEARYVIYERVYAIDMLIIPVTDHRAAASKIATRVTTRGAMAAFMLLKS